MSTNCLTLADVMPTTPGQSVAEALDPKYAALDYSNRYAEALREAAHAVSDGFDAVAAYCYESARRIAHVAVDHGNYGPILDQLDRAYA